MSAVLVSAAPVFATLNPWGTDTERDQFKEATKLGNVDLKQAIGNIINIVLGFLGIITVILVLYGGFLWMTAAGNEEKVTQAKQLLMAGVIGLAIIIAAFGLAQYILTNLITATTTP